MKFFFPDSQDQADPSFDFQTEGRSVHRVRQRDDLYCHEILGTAPYDGMLVSKAVVDGRAQGTARYTIAQRNRLYREGVRGFLRLDDTVGQQIAIMGDCGAFSYVRDDRPPYSVDDVIDFYASGFDFGVSIDHVILAYDEGADLFGIDSDLIDAEWRRRQQITFEFAEAFRDRCLARKVRFTPVGVAQGWSPLSYAHAVNRLQQMGYSRIGLGGMVPLKTTQILNCLKAIRPVLAEDTQLHLFGVSRCDFVNEFALYGVTSFDSTSPFRQAFKDMSDNYYTPNRNFVALRVPQVDGNATLKRRILAGEVVQETAMRLEQACLKELAAFDKGTGTHAGALESLLAYERLLDGGREPHRGAYAEVLEIAPWRQCGCAICREIGIQVMIFRGAERNKRRGFHNVYVFNRRLHDHLAEA